MMPLRVLIAGGGVAGVEAALALRHLAGARVAVQLLSPSPDYVQRPASVTTPFAGADALRLPLDPLDALGVSVVRTAVAAVDPAGHRVLTTDASEIAYDALVVAVGARVAESVPGALHFRGPLSAGAVEAVIRDTAAEPGAGLTFVVPPVATWSLPIYELTLMAARTLGPDAVAVVTPETRPLELFGRTASDAVARLLDRAGVHVRTRETARAVFEGNLLLAGGALVPAGRVVTLPALRGPRVEGLPHDADGFIRVDDHARVPGLDAVYAAGDGTAGRVKQGGVAAQQADVAAACIAQAAGVDIAPEPVQPVLRAILTTGDDPLYLRTPLGAADGDVSARALWQPAGKVAGRHLAGYLAAGDPALLLEDSRLAAAAATVA
jgi:sulfide:quinone oxidoreductase